MFFEKFDEIASNPKAWVYKGEELEYAADILAEFEKLHVRPSRKYSDDVYEHTFISVMPQVIMLYSFSLENYIKALLINDKKIMLDDKGGLVFDDNGKTSRLNHTLIDYLRMLNIDIDQDSEKVLKMYERHIFWEGRYPSPLYRDKYLKKFDKNNVGEWPNTYFPIEDIKNIKRVAIQLRDIIEEEIFKL